MKRLKTITCLLAVLIVNSALAAVRYVPEEYATIQAAINACRDSDTVVIAPGRYSGSGNRNISFKGKAITVRSTDPADPQIVNTTVIDCEGQGRGFVFYIGESADSTVTGLTVTNGYALLGGAIYCYNNSSPSITNCVITANSAVFGGAVACTNSGTKPRITNCSITSNVALVGGGGFYLNASSPIIKNCIISENAATDAGAIYSHNAGSPVVGNCTITGNIAYGSAGAIYCYKSSNLNISHSILWADTAANASEILVASLGAATSIRISYCDIRGGKENVILDNGCTVDWGRGNIDLDPYFVNIDYLSGNQIITAGNYHLLDDSPCIDAGDPDFVAEPGETDIDGNPRIAGAKIDIGADEVVPVINAVVKVMPKTLNLRSSGKYISCIIQLPGEYSIGDVDTDTIVLNEQVRPAWYRTDEASNKLFAKLGRYQTGQLLKDSQGLVELTVTGELYDGTKFEGSDTIRVLTSGKPQAVKGAVSSLTGKADRILPNRL